MSRLARLVGLIVAGLVSSPGCTERQPPAPPLDAMKPRPLPRLDAAANTIDGGDPRHAAYEVERAPVYGERPPEAAKRVRLEGARARLGDESFVLERAEDLTRLIPRLGAVVILESDAESYLAQAAPLLAALDVPGIRLWVAHPSGAVAFPLELKDEAEFQEWLDAVQPGRVRVIQRADGFELQTAVGKLPGPDPNGPSVPLRGGKMDLATLRRGITQLKDRFDTAEELCFLPSYGTELSKLAEAVGANWSAMGEPLFERGCLVYPRPSKRP